MEKYSQLNLVDFLIEHMPELKQRLKSHGDAVDVVLANALYKMWKNKTGQVGDKSFKKPSDIPVDWLKSMQDQGLIEAVGDNVVITARGSNIIKTMILGDDRSAFAKSKEETDYRVAKANTQTPSKLKKQGKKNQDLWWDRFNGEV